MTDEPQANQETQATKDAVETPVPPILVQPVAPDQKPQEPETKQTNATHEREPAKWTDIVMAIFTVVMALATIAIGVLAYRQWVDSGKLNDAATEAATAADKFKDSAAHLETIIGKAQLNMQTMADSSKNSIQATQDAMRLDQRAWVAEVATMMDAPEIGKKISLHITWSNSGKSFAKKVKSTSHLAFFPSEVTSEDVLLKTASAATNVGTPSVGVLAPNAQYRTTLESPVVVQQADKDRIFGDWYTYVWGELSYKDVFGHPHMTIFCSYRQGITNDFVQCSFHNDAD